MHLIYSLISTLILVGYLEIAGTLAGVYISIKFTKYHTIYLYDACLRT